MARKHEPLNFAGSLEVQSQKPLDGRRKVTLIADLTDAASFPYIYKGLDVFCEENSKWYTFLGGDSTDANNWRMEGSGGGGQDNVIESISVNGIAQAVDANKNVDLLVPTYSKNTAAFAAYDEGAEFNLQPSTNGMTASWAEGTTVVSSELTSKTYVDGELAGKSSFDIASISTAGGGSEVHATLSQDTDTADINYYKTTELPNALNLNIGSDSFRIPTTGYVDTEVAKKGNAKITFDNEYQYLQIRDDNGTDIGFTQETANTVRVQEYAKDNRGQVQTIFDETLASKTYVDGALANKQDKLVSGQNIKTINNQPITGEGNLEIGGGNAPYVYWDDAIFGYSSEDGDKFDIYCDQDTLRKLDFKFRNTDPTSEPKNFTVPTKVVTDELQSQIDTLDTRVGVHIKVGEEKWQGTYTDENGETFQVYSKMVYIPALPATAGITTYDHGVSNIKQILNIYGFTADGFVLNAPRQNAQDNIAIYQASKSATNQTFSIEVGKDRSSKKAYVVMVYAKNN